MGERDLGPEPAAARHPPWGWIALVAALAALVPLGWAAPEPLTGTAAAGRALAARGLLAALAPLAEAHAAVVANVAWLALAAAFAGPPLTRRIGSSAPALIGLAIFGSATWALVWAPGADLAPLALAVAAFALAYAGEDRRMALEPVYRPAAEGAALGARWLAVGLLLAELVPYAPLNAGLLLPAALALPKTGRRPAAVALVGGWLAGLAAEAAVAGPVELIGSVAGWSWDGAAGGWNLLYLFLGRHVGVLCGYLPVVLLLSLGGRGRRRPGLAATALVLAALSCLASPFDFAGGWINRSFLPLFGALWLYPSRPPGRLAVAAILLLCGLVGWPLWAPPGPAATADGGLALTSSWPRRLLPYETTLGGLPDGGEAHLDGLVARAVRGCRYLPESGRFELAEAGPAEILLVASPSLEMVGLEFGPGAKSRLTVRGAELGHTLFRPDGRVGFEVLLSRPRARHPLAPNGRRQAVHLLSFEMPDRPTEPRLKFQLLAMGR